MNERRCAGCGLCVTACPYDARVIDDVSGKATVLVELCKGCGTCVVSCPNAASQQESYERSTVMDILDEVMT
ncbi:4Fe-4S binding protein [Candidatus Bipolaricaulota bacterium]